MAFGRFIVGGPGILAVYSIKHSLQVKVFTIFLLMAVALVTGSYAVLHQFILPAFQDLEFEQSQADLARVEQAIQGQLQSLRAIDLEYAWWDGSYEFVRDPESHPGFVKNNGLNSRYWNLIDVQMMLFFDRNGGLVWGDLIDPRDGHQLPLAKNLQPWARPGHPLVTQQDERSGALGFIRLPAGLMLAAAFPVLRNDLTGPIAGSVVVGRFVTSNLILGLGHADLDNIAVYPLAGPALSASVRQAAATLLATPAPTVTAQTRKHTYVRKLLRDVTGLPVGVLEVATPRRLGAFGLNAEVTALRFLTAITVLFIVTGWFLFRRWMLAPLLDLQNHIAGMRESRKLTVVKSKREDEIGSLAAEFNHLVKALGQAWRDLEKSRDEALQLANVKGEFLAAMSHEIRTPMNGVLGMAELLQATKLDPRQQEFVRGIRNSGELLLSVINDILDFSRMESGKLQLEATSFNLTELLENTLDLMALQAHSKGLELLLSMPSGIDHEFIGDANRLRQILINLVGNAIKFTHKGQVLLSVSVGQREDGTVQVRFEVSDTGIGIEQANQENIFDAFSQADTSLARRYGGTGLGLSICRQLVNLMDGKIGLESKAGKGSVFRFTLPLRMSGNIVRAPELAAGLQELRILVVDDNGTCRDIVKRQLEDWKLHPEIAADGKTALAMLEQASTNGEPYALLLLDWHMPGMDGPELVRCIEAEKRICRPRVIIMGSAMDNDEAAIAARLGIDAFLSKPVHGAKLSECLRRLCLEPTSTKPPAKAPEPAVEQPLPSDKKVLLVEDNVVNQDVARFMLEACGCDVSICDNGADAVLLMSRQRFDLVLMDCSMPGMDGFEATRRIRESERTLGRHTPIIALTANVLEGVRERCLNVGMDDYLPKPFSKPDLLQILQRWLPDK